MKKYYYITTVSQYDKSVLSGGIHVQETEYFTDVLETNDPFSDYSKMAELEYMNNGKLLCLISLGEITEEQFNNYWKVSKDE